MRLDRAVLMQRPDSMPELPRSTSRRRRRGPSTLPRLPIDSRRSDAQIPFALRQVLLASLTTIVATATIATTASSSFASVRPHAIPVPKKNAAVAALVPKSVAKTGSISFAEDASYAPDEFIAADGHTVIGMDADLASALAAVMGLKAHVVNATSDTIIPGLSSGKYNVGLSSFTITAARQAGEFRVIYPSR